MNSAPEEINDKVGAPTNHCHELINNVHEEDNGNVLALQAKTKVKGFQLAHHSSHWHSFQALGKGERQGKRTAPTTHCHDLGGHNLAPDHCVTLGVPFVAHEKPIRSS